MTSAKKTSPAPAAAPQPPAPVARGSLKVKLRRVMLGILVPMSLATLACVAFMQYRLTVQGAEDAQRLIRDAISSKARVLTASHALALRGLVLSNAIGDVRSLVEQAVEGDSDIVYGLFLGSDGRAWAYVAPTVAGGRGSAELERWRELRIPPASLVTRHPRERTLRLFGHETLEFAAPVHEDDELLGTIRYGFSKARMRAELASARARAERTLTTTLLILLGLAAIDILVGMGLIGRASARISEPLASLTDAANTIAAGRRDVRVSVRSNDELEILAGAFNHMLEVNQRTVEQLEETTERALEAARLKSEFLANMSHEIRTPMNGVIGITQLMLQAPLNDKLRRYAQTIDASASALMTIINDVLDFSKMEAGKYELQSVSFEPRSIVQDVVELLAIRAAEKRIELVCRVAPDVPTQLVGDPDRLRQVLNNLVGNAVKFTERGEIYVNMRMAHGDSGAPLVQVDITDTGIGIAEKDLPALFAAFSQVDGSMVRKHGGTGLGLAISKRLVEMMGGSIQVWSRPDMGSQFWFTFRATPAETSERWSQPFLALPAKPQVLIVEENRRWSEAIAEQLKAWGMESDVYATSHDALAALVKPAHLEAAFDVVIIGRHRADDPTALLRELRGRGPAGKPWVIALTQSGAGHALDELEGGAAAQLSKPLRMSDLRQALQDLFTGRRRRREAATVSRPAPLRTRRKLLVVEDNAINQLVAVEQLREAGYEVDVANDGAEGVELILGGDYAMVLMDCQMPVMDGYTATRTIRTHEQSSGKHQIIVALTAHAMAGERDRVLAAGMDDYMTKPLRADTLERMVIKYVVPDTPSAPPASPPSTPPAASRSTPPASPPVLAGDVSRSRRLVDTCLREMPKQMSEIERAFLAGERAALRAAAHKLKGSAMAIAADALAEVAEELQHRAEQQQLEGAGELIEELSTRFLLVEGALRAEQAGAAASASRGPPA